MQPPREGTTEFFLFRRFLKFIQFKYFNSHYRELKKVKISMEGFRFFGEDKIIYFAYQKFQILNLTDKSDTTLFDAKRSISFEVIGDRFIVSLEFRGGDPQLVLWNLKTSVGIDIQISGFCSTFFVLIFYKFFKNFHLKNYVSTCALLLKFFKKLKLA